MSFHDENRQASERSSRQFVDLLSDRADCLIDEWQPDCDFRSFSLPVTADVDVALM